MNHSIEIDKIYEVKQSSKDKCGNFRRTENAKFIRIDYIDSNSLYYSILNNNYQKLDNCVACLKKNDLILTNKQNSMKTLSAKIKRLFSPTKQKLYKADFINDCGDLTEEGWGTLKVILLEKHEEELVKEAEEKIKEEHEV